MLIRSYDASRNNDHVDICALSVRWINLSMSMDGIRGREATADETEACRKMSGDEWPGYKFIAIDSGTLTHFLICERIRFNGDGDKFMHSPRRRTGAW